MTIKELAEIAGVSKETIRRYGRKYFPSFHVNGVKVDYDESVSKQIIENVKKKNMVSLVQPTQSVEQPTQSVELLEMFKMMLEQNQKFMGSMIERMDKLEGKKPSQLALPSAPDIKPRALLRQLVNDYAVSVNISHQESWNELYKQFYYRCNESIKTKAKNLKIIPLDYLENENKLLTACSIMKDLINN